LAGRTLIRPGDRVEVCIGDGDNRRATEEIVRELGGHVVDGRGDVYVSDEWTAEHDTGVLAARARGARVTTLAELIIARHEGPWIGVTGTAGKSSTCHALAHILRRAGRPVVMSSTARSGNAWPDWSLAGQPAAPGAVLIAELTSTHLCHMDSRLTPDVAVVTLIRPDHPDLHPSEAAYVAAKARLVPPAGMPAAVVLPSDDPGTVAALPPDLVASFTFGAGDAPTPGAHAGDDGRIRIADGHTAVDADAVAATGTGARAALAGAAAAVALGLPPAQVAAALGAMPTTPHRQNLVGRLRGASVIDDTLAATPRKTRAALREYADRDPVFVIGGDPAAHPPGDLDDACAALVAANVRVVTFGPMGQRVAQAVGAISTSPTVMGALGTAATLAGDGGLVVVSPMFAVTPAERDRVAALPEP
jgi:UDP-N-acetylmuramoylalanine--D-glutamate ligase